MVLNWSHEITPELDVDWTLCPEDSAKELRLREVRDEMIKEQLQLGKPVIYRSSGWSLYPRVWPNDQCTYEPVTSADEVEQTKGALQNLCVRGWKKEVTPEVDVDWTPCPGDWAKELRLREVRNEMIKDGEWYFTISNLKGRSNGWCSIEHIYGRLIRVEH